MATNLCSLFDQRTAIVSSTLYFTSGSYLYTKDRGPRGSDSIFSIDLSSDLQINGPLPIANISSFDAPKEITDSRVAGGVFWGNNDHLWTYASVKRSDNIDESVNQTDSMLQYDIQAKTWEPQTIEGGEYTWFNQTNGIHASSPDGRHYYTGGAIGQWGDDAGMLLFESDLPKPKWTFIKEERIGSATPGTAGGQMIYVPVGEKGALVVFGGWDTTTKGTQFAGMDWGLRSFEDIYVYDIATNIWDRISATSDSSFPVQRAEFCSVVNSAGDGTYNIVMYGGWSQFYQLAFSDVWILNLPAFKWIEVEDQNNPDTFQMMTNMDKPRVGEIGRTRHKCNLYKDTQMIVTGGIVSQKPDQKRNIDACNATHPPFMVLDTTDFVWKGTIDAAGGKYRTPAFVKDVTKNRLAPPDGWPNTRLANLFSVDPSSTPTDTSTLPPPTSTDPSSLPPPSSSSSSTLSKGGIAGITVGMVCIIAILVGLIFYLLRRRRRMDPEPLPPAPYSGYYSPGGGGNPPVWPGVKHELPSNEAPRSELDPQGVKAELSNGATPMTPVAELPTQGNKYEMGVWPLTPVGGAEKR